MGDDIVEAAGMGGGLQAETGDRRQPGVGRAGEHTLGGSWGSLLVRTGSIERVGRKAGGAVRCHDSRYLEGWQSHPPRRYLWEVALLRVLRGQPEGHGRFNPLWMVQGHRGRNGKI